MSDQKLSYGATALVPADVSVAWGARLIVSQDGYTDLVWNRQSSIGDDDAANALCDKLNRAPWRKNLETMLLNYTVRTDKAEDVTVFEDDDIIVRGNTNGSYGYFYVAAWPKS